jgi:A/G-specific adenine glycosylase
MNYSCFAFEKNLVNQIPLKNKKNQVKNRYLNYLVINFLKNKRKYIYIRKRTKTDIWKGLYDFPCIESNEQINPSEFPFSSKWKTFFENKKLVIKTISVTFKHQLSHQTLYAHFYEIEIKTPFKDNPADSKPILRNKIKKYAVPRLVDKYIQTTFFIN